MFGGAAPALVLAVALPHDPAVGAVGVPGLRTEGAAALAAANLVGEQVHAAVTVTSRTAGCQLALNHVEDLERDYRLMVALDVILGHLAHVGHLLLGEEVLDVALLQQGIALVLLVGEDGLHAGDAPRRLARRRRHFVDGQLL